MQYQGQKVTSEFEHLHECVDREQEAVLSRLAEEERDLQQKVRANSTAFSEHVSTLPRLPNKVAERSAASEVRRRAEIGSARDRGESLKPPAPCSFQLRREGCSLPPQDLALQKILQKFRREVTLDPETAHPNLLASEGKKSDICEEKPGVPQTRRDC